jgi:hypothetical protein
VPSGGGIQVLSQFDFRVFLRKEPIVGRGGLHSWSGKELHSRENGNFVAFSKPLKISPENSKNHLTKIVHND